MKDDSNEFFVDGRAEPLPFQLGKYFNLDEVKCHHCGRFPTATRMRSPMMTRFVAMLDYARESIGKPVRVNSWYRCKQHPIERVKLEPGVHSTGLAVDLALSHEDAYFFMGSVFAHARQVELHTGDKDSNITLFHRLGIGVEQKGSARYLHVDIGGCLHQWCMLRPTIWSY